jgi:hypothetical protein
MNRKQINSNKKYFFIEKSNQQKPNHIIIFNM